ncbi:MAG: Tim44-like domain-containing protein [Caldimonas sp.]
MLSLIAGLWVMLGTHDAAVGARGLVAVACAVVLLGSALWFWRRSAARGGPPARRAPSGPLMARQERVDIPAGLDGEQVLAAACGRFMGLQAAWDARDVPTLTRLTTPEMLEELLHVLTAREAGDSRTDVISLHAELLGLEELSADYLASVEFSGLIRESAEQGAVPFRELWMLACTKDGAPSWRLARQQALL